MTRPMTQSPPTGELVAKLEAKGIKPIGWFLPWNETHGYQQVAPEFNGDPELVPLFSANAITTLERERDEAMRAEDEAKDCFWAVYPAYVEAKGHGISTEAARTQLVAALAASQAEVERLKEALRKMHRRAQSAEGQRDAAIYDMDVWTSLSNVRSEWFVMKVIASIRRAINRRAALQVEESKG